jgi:chromosome segregation ATPase
MKSLYKIAVTASMLLVAVPTVAKTNVEGQIEQLKVNAENSEFNYRQYQDNLDVVNKNVEQSDKAIKDLRQMKKQLITNTQNVDKNKKALADMEKDIQSLKAKEQVKMQKEDQQIAEVKKILEKLEANKKKREENLLAYDKMTEQVKQEQKDWDTQVQQMATLQKDLDAKELKATEEKTTWQAKRKDYEAEAKKWEAKAAESRNSHSKIKKIKD